MHKIMKVKNKYKQHYQHYEFDGDLRRKNNKSQSFHKYKSNQVNTSSQNYVYRFRKDNQYYKNNYNSKFLYHPIRRERESSPIDGSDELTQRKIQETSDMIKRQLMYPENSQYFSQTNAPELPHKQSSKPKVVKVKKQYNQMCTGLKRAKKVDVKASNQKLKKKTSKIKQNINYNVREIHTQIMNYFLKLNYGRRQNLINADITSYDTAIQQIYKKKSLELSQALREMSHQEKPEASEVVNSIIPDFAIKFEELPVNVIRELSSCFENFVTDGVSLTDSFYIQSSDIVHNSMIPSTNQDPYMTMNQEDRILHLNSEDQDSFVIKKEISEGLVKEEKIDAIEIIDSEEEMGHQKNDNFEVNLKVKDTPENLDESIEIKSDEEELEPVSQPLAGTLRVCTNLFEQKNNEDAGNIEISSVSSCNIINEVLVGMKRNFLSRNEPETKDYQHATEKNNIYILTNEKNNISEQKDERSDESSFLTSKNQSKRPLEKRSYEYQTVSRSKIAKNECNSLMSGQFQNITSKNLDNNCNSSQDVLETNNSFNQAERDIHSLPTISSTVISETIKCTDSSMRSFGERSQQYGNIEKVEKLAQNFSSNEALDTFQLPKTQTQNIKILNSGIDSEKASPKTHHQFPLIGPDSDPLNCSLNKENSRDHKLSNEYISLTVNSICEPKTFREAITVMLKIDEHIEYLTKLRQNIFMNLNNESCLNKSKNLKKQSCREKKSLNKSKKLKKQSCRGKKRKREKMEDLNVSHSIIPDSEYSEKEIIRGNESSNHHSRNMVPDKEFNCEEILNSQFEITMDSRTVILQCKVVVEEHMIIVGTNRGEIQYFNITNLVDPLTVKLSQHEISCLKIGAIEGVRWVFSGTVEEPLLRIMKFRQYEYQTIRLEDGIQTMEKSWEYLFIGGPSGYLTRYNFMKKKIEFEDCISTMKICKVEASKEGPRKILVILLKDYTDCTHIHVRDAMSALHIRTIADNMMTCKNFFLRDSFAFIHSTKEMAVFNFCDGQFIRHFLESSEEEISDVYSVKNHFLVITSRCMYTFKYTKDVKDCTLQEKIPCDKISFLTHYKNEIIIYGTWSNKIKALKITDPKTGTSVM